ncbi:MAG: MFS transporter [Alphaproteobacteria bacterium]|nr:MAG: MFS transporter [Alphaproteobacteria bacterium]
MRSLRPQVILRKKGGIILADQATRANPGRYGQSWYRWYVLIILTGVYTFNFIDRQILVILQEPIKEDMGLSDTQLGLLSGFAFALIYVLAGIPIARFADKGNRRNIITVALVVWSSMTALSGLAMNYAQLLAARVGVAIGEAGGSPPAHSMISDVFKKEQRATALSIYSTGINFGGLIGLLAGGWIAQYMDWRIAFFVVGIPGVIYALLLRFTVQEAPRGFAEQVVETGDAPSMLETAQVLLSRRSFKHMAVAAGLHAFIGYGAANFAPSFFVRTHGLQIGFVGTWLAAAGIFGALGTFLGGYVTDKLMQRDERWYLWVPALSTIATLPFSMIIYNTGLPMLALSLTFVTGLTFSMYLAPNLALAHSLVGLRMRAMSSAVLFFILNIIGLGLGPLVVGMVSDALEPSFGKDSLRFSLIIVIVIVNLWCVFHYWMASRTVREDLAKAPNREKPSESVLTPEETALSPETDRGPE